MGQLARFFAYMRAARDPYEETLVFPALIVIIVFYLNYSKRFENWTVLAALVGTAVMYGALLAASLGFGGIFRAVLRCISVGAIEGAGYAIINKLDKSVAVREIISLMFLNYFFLWFPYMIVSAIRAEALITEKQWQADYAWRASIRAPINRFFSLALHVSILTSIGKFIRLISHACTLASIKKSIRLVFRASTFTSIDKFVRLLFNVGDFSNEPTSIIFSVKTIRSIFQLIKICVTAVATAITPLLVYAWISDVPAGQFLKTVITSIAKLHAK